MPAPTDPTTTSRRRRLLAPAALIAAVALLGACGRSATTANNTGSGGGSSNPNSTTINPTAGLVTTTAAGTKPVHEVVWAVYRDVNSLDPIFAFDYPENTADSLMCESLLRQAPDGSLGPGLATLSTPSPTTLVFTIRSGAKFWDGHPVTPADVVFSLDRAMEPKYGGFYTQVFSRVKSVAATGSNQVTITLKQPDEWLQGELASMPGIVIEKAFALKQGKNYGTPSGSIMCTGDYMLKSWTPGVGVLAVVNPHYWRAGVHPMAQEILIKGAPNTASFTAAMIAGNIQGSYTFALSTLPQLQKSSDVKVYQGPAESTDALIVCSFKGALGDVRVRQALSLALNRKAIIDAVYRGAALMPKWLSNPGTFGYGKSVFDKAYAASPYLTQDIAKAKKLVQEAHATGKTVTIGMSSELSNIAAVAGAYQSAGQAIGLNVKFKAVSAQDFINFFTDPNFRKGVDAFPTVNYGDYADPAAMLSTFDLPGGSQNYDNFNYPPLTKVLEQARSTANPDRRAALMVQAEKLTLQQLPWIPNTQPTSILLLNKKLSGPIVSFSYMFSPWADNLGGVG